MMSKRLAAVEVRFPRSTVPSLCWRMMICLAFWPSGRSAFTSSSSSTVVVPNIRYRSVRQLSASASPDSPSIAIVGGGASGIFSAIACAEALEATPRPSNAPLPQVTVLEATRKTLSKVQISGGGRCNVMHDSSKLPRDLLQGYPRGRKELSGMLYKRFTPDMCHSWFETRGVELKTEADGRMFPITDSSQTIINTLMTAAEEAHVDIQYKQKVESIAKTSEDGPFCITSQSTQDNQKVTQKSYYDAVIMATGSMPIGYKLAQEMGHSIVSTVPSLFTLNAKHEVKEDGFLHGLSGISVPFAIVSFKPETNTAAPQKKAKPLATQEGPLLVTHHGFSGPAVLRLSAFGARELHACNYRGTLKVQWAPHWGNTEDIFQDLWQLTTARPKKQVANQCPNFLPTTTTPAISKRLWAALAKRAGFSDTQIWAEASKKMVRKLAMQINECEIPITGKGTFKEEFVTAGGVSTKEIDFTSMQSKKTPGLFFCGELIDVDGVTGGYNFMNCWSTGYVAGNSAAEFVAQMGTE